MAVGAFQSHRTPYSEQAPGPSTANRDYIMSLRDREVEDHVMKYGRRVKTTRRQILAAVDAAPV